MPEHKPMIIAHRGAKGSAPENTLAAFKLGLEQGCEGIELDIHPTSDGEILVCHDPTLDRTTTGSGMICHKTLREIKSYDAGSWYGEAFRGETVPTLGEVFELVPESVMINVEVKDAYEGRMIGMLVDFLRKGNRLANVVISSFDHKCVQLIKQLEPEAKIGLLYAAKLLDPAVYARAFDVEVHSLHPYYELLDEEDVAKAKDLGLRVYPYTANDESDLLRLTRYGVSGIITDYPGKLARLLDK